MAAARASSSRVHKETCIAGFTVIAISLHLVLRYRTHAPPRLALAPLLVALLVGGTPLIFDLAKKLIKGEFGIRANLLRRAIETLRVILDDSRASAANTIHFKLLPTLKWPDAI